MSAMCYGEYDIKWNRRDNGATGGAESRTILRRLAAPHRFSISLQ